MTDELMKLLKEAMDYGLGNVHTSFPGVVESYNPGTRRANIQPSLKRLLPDGSFIDLPVLPDIPVMFPGSRKFTVHFPLEKGDEVAVFACERSTDEWRGKGGKGIGDRDLRRFSLNDCYCIPGLQAVDFIPAGADGFFVIHKNAHNGVFINSAALTDDKIELNQNNQSKIAIAGDSIEVETVGAMKLKTAALTLDSTAPVSIKEGLTKTALAPYLTAEGSALATLQSAVSAAASSLASAASGSPAAPVTNSTLSGFIASVLSALVAYATAQSGNDSTAAANAAKIAS